MIKNEFYVLTYLDSCGVSQVHSNGMFLSSVEAETARQTMSNPKMYSVQKLKFSSGDIAEIHKVDDQFAKLYYEMTIKERLVEALRMAADGKANTEEFKILVDNLKKISINQNENVRTLIQNLDDVRNFL